MNQEIKQKLRCVAAFGLGVALMAAVGQCFHSKSLLYQEKERFEIRLANKSYKFINPLLECEEINSLSNAETNNIRDKVVKQIDEEIKKGSINHASVYFRDLNNGPWFGINEKEEFSPGSLLKVPILMTLLKEAEVNPSVLSVKLVYKAKMMNFAQHFLPDQELVVGASYTMQELAERMVRLSDNESAAMITEYLGNNKMLKVYKDMGIKIPNDTNYELSVRTFGSFFRVLYNSSYLSYEYSEAALRMLSKTTFSGGLSAGVPASVVVAQKFGERMNSDGKSQLHNCGIVYYPGQPYILCVMTSGDDFDALAHVISKISEKVYFSISKIDN